METFGLVSVLVAAAALLSNVGLGALAVRRIRSLRAIVRDPPEPDRWPRAHVFVCLKGSLPDIRRTVLALDRQDYPGSYRVTFITEGAASGGDEAAARLAEMLPGTRRCDHTVAGCVLDRGARCAQKNFNLLAGIRHAEARHSGIDVYAFCDGDLTVSPEWLREMVRPLAAGWSEASTSFHYAGSDERRLLATLHGLAETAQSLASLVCRGTTWGGSTAIRAGAFARLGMARTWSRTCVDDVTMSRVLRQSGLAVTPVPQFLVTGRSDIGGYRSFVRWLGRQFFFVKVYLPSRWPFLWGKFAADVAALWIAAFHASHRILSGEWAAGAPAGWTSLAGAAAVLGVLPICRGLLPRRPPLAAWLGAALLAHGTGLLACADATLRRKRLTWKDLTYVLERDGRVARVTGPGEAAGGGPTSGPPEPPGGEVVPEEAVA